MKNVLFAFLLIIALNAKAQENAHRYEIKSGIAHSVTRLNEHETPAVQYFDDYGNLEAMTQTVDMGGLGTYENTTITKKDKAWFVNASGKPKGFDNPIADLTFIHPSEAVVEKYKIHDTGEEEEFLGKMCKKFTYETTQGRKTVTTAAWVYKGIILKSVSKIGRRESFFEMTDFQENVNVPAEVFVIPE